MLHLQVDPSDSHARLMPVQTQVLPVQAPVLFFNQREQREARGRATVCYETARQFLSVASRHIRRETRRVVPLLRGE